MSTAETVPEDASLKRAQKRVKVKPKKKPEENKVGVLESIDEGEEEDQSPTKGNHF